jgi:hypothetical protein
MAATATIGSTGTMTAVTGTTDANIAVGSTLARSVLESP